jgi:hypothetical protein
MIYKGKKEKQFGFTIVEVIVAFALIFVVMGLIYGVFPQVLKALLLSENHANAAYIGRSLLEDETRIGFDNIVPLPEVSTTLLGLNEGRTRSQVYNYTVSVQSVNTDKKMVWATVSWKEFGKTRQVIIEKTFTRK